MHSTRRARGEVWHAPLPPPRGRTGSFSLGGGATSGQVGALPGPPGRADRGVWRGGGVEIGRGGVQSRSTGKQASPSPAADGSSEFAVAARLQATSPAVGRLAAKSWFGRPRYSAEVTAARRNRDAIERLVADRPGAVLTAAEKAALPPVRRRARSSITVRLPRAMEVVRIASRDRTSGSRAPPGRRPSRCPKRFRRPRRRARPPGRLRVGASLPDHCPTGNPDCGSCGCSWRRGSRMRGV